MIEFYWSEDKGLLDQKESIFLKKNKSPLILKKPDVQKLKLSFLQCNLEEENDSYIVWDYSGSFEKLKDFLSFFEKNSKPLLFLQNSKPEPTSLSSLKKFFYNKKLKISRLSEKSRRNYISEKILEYRIPFSIDALEYIGNFLPNSASEINSFFSTLEIYFSEKEISLQEAKQLLKLVDVKEDNFSFFGEYLNKNTEKWVKSFSLNTSNQEMFKSFLAAFFYKIFEFKNFLELRKKNLNLLEISKIIGRNIYFLNEYESFFYQWNEKKDFWLETFIVNLFFLADFCISDFPFKIYLLRHFLIRNSF